MNKRRLWSLCALAALLAIALLFLQWRQSREEGARSPGAAPKRSDDHASMPAGASPKLQSIRVMPANASVAKGLTAKFKALAFYSDNEVRDVTERARWESSASASVASHAPGSFECAEVGFSTIRAVMNDVAGVADLTVTASALVSIAITPALPALALGESVGFAASGSYADGTVRDVTKEALWESANAQVAAVSARGGVSTALAEGTSIVTAQIDEIVGLVALRVEPASLVAINVFPAKVSATVGDVLRYRATATSSDGSEQDLTAVVGWLSSNESVLKFENEHATGTARSRGTALISATFSGMRGSTEITVR